MESLTEFLRTGERGAPRAPDRGADGRPAAARREALGEGGSGARDTAYAYADEVAATRPLKLVPGDGRRRLPRCFAPQAEKEV